MSSWTGEPVPESGDWSWVDFALIIAAFVVLGVLGIVSAGGPS